MHDHDRNWLIWFLACAISFSLLESHGRSCGKSGTCKEHDKRTLTANTQRLVHKNRPVGHAIFLTVTGWWTYHILWGPRCDINPEGK